MAIHVQILYAKLVGSYHKPKDLKHVDFCDIRLNDIFQEAAYISTIDGVFKLFI